MNERLVEGLVHFLAQAIEVRAQAVRIRGRPVPEKRFESRAPHDRGALRHEDLEKTQSAIDRASDRINDAVKRNSMITGKLERIELPEDIEKGPQLDASYSDSTVLVE